MTLFGIWSPKEVDSDIRKVKKDFEHDAKETRQYVKSRVIRPSNRFKIK